MSDSRFITIRVPPEVAEGLRRIAEAEHRTLSAELRRLIELRIKEYEKEAA